MSVGPGSPRWDELKNSIVSNDERNWRLGDAALEIAPMGEDSANNGSTANLLQFLRELEKERGVAVKPKTMGHYRDVASAWPPPTRVGGASWKAHQILQRQDRHHLLKSGMTATEAQEAAGHRNEARRKVGRPKTPEAAAKAAELVVEKLADPEVAAEVKAKAAESKMSRKAEAALRAAEHELEAAQMAAEKREADAEREQMRMIEVARSQFPKVAQTWEKLTHEIHLSWEAIAVYMRLFDELPPIDPVSARMLDRELDQLRRQIEWFKNRLHPGGTNTVSEGVVIDATSYLNQRRGM